MHSAKCSTLGFLLLVSFLQIYIVLGIHIDPTRVKRGIFGTVTSTVYQIIENKVYVPTSCLYLEPNLPNCRNVRFLFPNQNGFGLFNTGNELNPTSLTKEKSTTAINAKASRREDADQIQTAQINGWGEYLGFYQPTVIVTQNITQTTTLKDPAIAITYAVKGCKPRHMPDHLDKCPEEDPLELAEILPTTTVLSKIEATKITEKRSPETHGVIDSAEIDKVQEFVENNRATESL